MNCNQLKISTKHDHCCKDANLHSLNLMYIYWFGFTTDLEIGKEVREYSRKAGLSRQGDKINRVLARIKGVKFHIEALLYLMNARTTYVVNE